MATIHVCLNGQLGNCLRNTASMAILAEHIGADWDIDLAQSYSPLHVNKVIKALFPGRIKWRQPGSYPILDEKALLRFVDVYGTNSHPLVEAVMRRPRGNFGMHHIYAFRPASMTDEEYLRRKLAFFQTIAAPDWLLEDARRFAKARAGGTLEQVIGCHIRHTDNLFDPKKSALSLNTPVATFISRLEKLGDAAILLCSDDARVKEMVSKCLPGARIIFPNTCSKHLDLWQPFYEMRLLGETRRLIGSMASTFSYETCFWRGIDLELFRNHAWQSLNISEFAAKKTPAGPCLVEKKAARRLPNANI